MDYHEIVVFITQEEKRVLRSDVLFKCKVIDKGIKCHFGLQWRQTFQQHDEVADFFLSI